MCCAHFWEPGIQAQLSWRILLRGSHKVQSRFHLGLRLRKARPGSMDVQARSWLLAGLSPSQAEGPLFLAGCWSKASLSFLPPGSSIGPLRTRQQYFLREGSNDSSHVFDVIVEVTCWILCIRNKLLSPSHSRRGVTLGVETRRPQGAIAEVPTSGVHENRPPSLEVTPGRDKGIHRGTGASAPAM